MRGLNRVTLIGNCGKEPEYKQLEDGTFVVKIALATTEIFRLKNGETQSRTDWHTIILWRGLAGLAKEYVRKGSLLYVEGKLRNRQYDDKDGVKKYVTGYWQSKSSCWIKKLNLLQKKFRMRMEMSCHFK